MNNAKAIIRATYLLLGDSYAYSLRTGAFLHTPRRVLIAFIRDGGVRLTQGDEAFDFTTDMLVGMAFQEQVLDIGRNVPVPMAATRNVRNRLAAIIRGAA